MGMTSSAKHKSHYSVFRKLLHVLSFDLYHHGISDRLVLLLLEMDEDELKLLDSILIICSTREFTRNVIIQSQGIYR